jgi:HSP90 family molecular chaperone
VKWESDGQGEFTVEPIEKPTRGTDVILHLRDDAKEFLNPGGCARSSSSIPTSSIIRS